MWRLHCEGRTLPRWSERCSSVHDKYVGHERQLDSLWNLGSWCLWCQGLFHVCFDVKNTKQKSPHCNSKLYFLCRANHQEGGTVYCLPEVSTSFLQFVDGDVSTYQKTQLKVARRMVLKTMDQTRSVGWIGRANDRARDQRLMGRRCWPLSHMAVELCVRGEVQVSVGYTALQKEEPDSYGWSDASPV